MLGVQTVNIAREINKFLEAHNRHQGALVVMSKEFGRELAVELCPEAGAEGAEPDSIAGMPVVYKDDVEVPTIITADGKAYDILPDWAHEGRVLAQATRIQLADMRDGRQANLGKIPALPVGRKS